MINDTVEIAVVRNVRAAAKDLGDWRERSQTPWRVVHLFQSRVPNPIRKPPIARANPLVIGRVRDVASAISSVVMRAAPLKDCVGQHVQCQYRFWRNVQAERLETYLCFGLSGS
jgi:predicted ATPase